MRKFFLVLFVFGILYFSSSSFASTVTEYHYYGQLNWASTACQEFQFSLGGSDSPCQNFGSYKGFYVGTLISNGNTFISSYNTNTGANYVFHKFMQHPSGSCPASAPQGAGGECILLPPSCDFEAAQLAFPEPLSSTVIRTLIPPQGVYVETGISTWDVCSNNCKVHVSSTYEIGAFDLISYEFNEWVSNDVTNESCDVLADPTLDTNSRFLSGTGGASAPGVNDEIPEPVVVGETDPTHDPEDPNTFSSDGKTKDTDSDGIPDSSDADIDGDGILNSVDDDVDGDGVANADDGTPDGQDDVLGDASDCSSPPVSTGDSQLSAIHKQLWMNECMGGTVEGLNSCDQPVTCVGDAVDCALLQLNHEHKCYVAEVNENMISDLEQFYEDEGLTDLNDYAEGGLFDEMVFNGGGESDVMSIAGMSSAFTSNSQSGSCPAPITVSLQSLGSVQIPFDFFCNLVSMLRPIFLMICSFIGGGIILRSLRYS